MKKLLLTCLLLVGSAFGQLGQFGGGTSNGSGSSGTLSAGTPLCIGGDTGWSRSAAAIWNAGTCANGNATGTINAATINAGSGVFSTGTGAGQLTLGQGAAPGALTANTWNLYAPATLTTSYGWTLPAAGNTGAAQGLLVSQATGSPLNSNLSFLTLSNPTTTGGYATFTGTLTNNNVACILGTSPNQDIGNCGASASLNGLNFTKLNANTNGTHFTATTANKDIYGVCAFAAATTCSIVFTTNYSSTPGVLITPLIPGSTTFTVTAVATTGFTITASASFTGNVAYLTFGDPN